MSADRADLRVHGADDDSRPAESAPADSGTAAPTSSSEADRGAQDLAGLDALETVKAERTPFALRLLKIVGSIVLALGVFVLIWQIYIWTGSKPRYVVPAPSDVWDSLWSNHHVELVAAWTSLRRAIVGFVVALAIGTVLGLVVARINFIRVAIKPILSGLQSLPSVAWVPAAIIWFHITNAAIYFVILMGAVPSIALGLVAGVDQIPPVLIRAGRVLGARRLTAARHVLLPAALPGYLAGLKQGWAFAWRSLMAGELIANSPDLGVGLGRLLENNSNYGTMADVIAAIVSIFIVGVGIDLVFFSPLERAVLRNRGLSTAQ